MDQPESPYVSFTDLFVGLIFVFMLLVATLAMNVHPLVKPGLEEDKLSELTSGLGNRLQDRGVKVVVDGKNGRLMLSDTNILFKATSAELSESGVKAVNELAHELRRILPPHVQDLSRQDNTPSPPAPLIIDTILIEGHADATPIHGNAGKYADNTELSSARARAVELKMFEVEPELAACVSGRSKRDGRPEKLFGIAGYGEGRPAAANLSPNDPANRRVEIHIIARPESSK